jgi:hypothetical protein
LIYLLLGVDISNSKNPMRWREDGASIACCAAARQYQEIGRDEMVTRLTQSITNPSPTSDHAGTTRLHLLRAAGADTAEDFTVLRQAFNEAMPNTPFDFDTTAGSRCNSARPPTRHGGDCGTGNTNLPSTVQGSHAHRRVEEMLGTGWALRPSAAMRGAARRSEDGRVEPTILTRMLPAAFGLRDNSEFINLENNSSFVEKVISVLFEAAQRGMEKAADLLGADQEVVKIVNGFTILCSAKKNSHPGVGGLFFKARFHAL